MQHPQARMAEEGRPRPWVLPRLGWAMVLRLSPLLLLLSLLLSFTIGYICCDQFQRPQQKQLEPLEVHVAELQLNLTVPRKDPTLSWAAGPTLGRSFTHGPGLEKGQLYIHRAGIYRLHIQVTLANCSSAYGTVQHRATVTVGICSPAAHSITLLRLPFGQSCTVASQRLTHLAVGDVLCTNLTLPLLPSCNAEETFFGVHWVYP